MRALADSACDRSVQQVAARRQEPAENEPTSTVSEETEPAERPSAPEVSDRDGEELSSVIGHPDFSLSQWQPRVSLFRLPVSLPRPGSALPGFRLVPGDAKDEIYLEEISQENTQVGGHLSIMTFKLLYLRSWTRAPFSQRDLSGSDRHAVISLDYVIFSNSESYFEIKASKVES